MKEICNSIIGFIMLILWIIGVAVTTGAAMWWSIIPPVAWIYAARFFLGVPL